MDPTCHDDLIKGNGIIMNKHTYLKVAARLMLTMAVALPASASAQAWPSKPIRIIVPFPPGGSTDTAARAVASKFQEYLGLPGVVENRAGANGRIGAELVAKAEPDGHTIMVAAIGVLSINAALFKDLRYHPERDFEPITVLVTTPNMLIARPNLPAKTIGELIQYAKKSPGRISFCSSGTGSSDHLTSELFKQMSGIFAVHVPYRGGALCQADVMGGQVDFAFQNVGAVTEYIKSDRLKGLAVASKSRHPRLQNVPTLVEAGFPGLVVDSWQGAVAPAKTPRDVVAKLNDAMVRALRSPEIRERIVQAGFDVVANTPEEFAAFMKAEIDRWTKVVNIGGIKAE